MNLREIRALAAILRQSDLTALEVSEGDNHIRLERGLTAAPSATPIADLPAEPVHEPPAAEENDFNNLTEVKAPMVGVFYAAPSPEAAPFVKVGDRVEKGQTVCVIEAMKLMNDIVAPVSGVVADVCVQDGAVLEYGQTLLKIM